MNLTDGFFCSRIWSWSGDKCFFSFFRLFSTKKQSLTTYLEVVKKRVHKSRSRARFFDSSQSRDLTKCMTESPAKKNIQGDSTKSNKKLEKEGFRQVFFFSWQRGLVLIQISRKWELHPRDIIMWSQKREAAFWQIFLVCWYKLCFISWWFDSNLTLRQRVFFSSNHWMAAGIFCPK